MSRPGLYSERIVKVIPRNEQPITTFYAVAVTDLIERTLTVADTNMIEVVPYDLRHNKDLVYVAAVKALVPVNKVGCVPDLVMAVAKDDRAAYYATAVMKTNTLGKIGAYTADIPYPFKEPPLCQTPLHIIARGQNKNLFEFVLKRMDRSGILKRMKKGCEYGCIGDTVLHQVIRHNRIELFRSLVKIRPDLMSALANIANEIKSVPLHLAVVNNSTEMIDTLMPHTKPASIVNSREVGYILDNAITKGHNKFVKMVLNDDYLRREIVGGRSWLLRTAAKCSYKIFKPIYEAVTTARHSVTETDYGVTFFTLMIQLGNSDTAVQLMKHPAFDESLLTIPDLHGNTPLHWAATAGLHEVCKAMYPTYVNAGLLFEKNDLGRTALAQAACMDTPYKQLGPVNNKAVVALLISDKDMGDKLIAIDDNNGLSPLFLALWFNAGADICEALYDRMSAEQVCRQYTDHKFTVLHRACSRKKTEFIDAVMKDKVKSQGLLTLCDAEGRTALQDAKGMTPSMYKHLKCVIKSFEQ